MIATGKMSTQKRVTGFIFETLFDSVFWSYFANELILQGVPLMRGRIKRDFQLEIGTVL